MSETKFKIQAYSQQQLRGLYNVGKKTWISWIRPISEALGEIKGKVYTPKQVETIVNHLGEP